MLALRVRLAADGTPLRSLAHVTGGGLPGNVPRALPEGLGARLDPSAWPLSSVHRLVAGMAGMDGPELRATLNGGLGMVAIVPREARTSAVAFLAARDLPAWVIGEVVPIGDLGGRLIRRARRRGRCRSWLNGRRPSPSAFRVRAPICERSSPPSGAGVLGGRIGLVFADRPCAALDWAAAEAIPTALVRGGDDLALASRLAAAAPDAIVLAGYMRILGPVVLDRYLGRILNVHPSLLPAFPGARAIDDAIAAGVAVTGCTIHVVNALLDGGPIVMQAPVPILAADDADALRARIQAAEHRLLPRA